MDGSKIIKGEQREQTKMRRELRTQGWVTVLGVICPFFMQPLGGKGLTMRKFDLRFNISFAIPYEFPLYP